MKFDKKLRTGLLLGASALALVACSANGESTASSLEEATAKYDSIKQGELTMEYNVSSNTYGDYKVDLTGQFEKNDFDTSTSETDKEETKESESSEETESSESTEEAKVDPSRGYDYHLVEKTSVYVDGQETNSTGEVVALGDTLYDKVFLTGSEADGKFVYDSRDVGITEYPLANYVDIQPVIDAFDLEGNDIKVEKGELFNGEKGHVFTVTPEQVATSLQGEVGESSLGQNILGLVTEAEVGTVIIGVNEDTFSVQAMSTGDVVDEQKPTSESEESKESTKDSKGDEEDLVGYLLVSKDKSTKEIEAPANKMDIEEFSALIELYYQQMSEGELEEQLSEDEVYGEEANKALEEAQTEESEAPESSEE